MERNKDGGWTRSGTEAVHWNGCRRHGKGGNKRKTVEEEEGAAGPVRQKKWEKRKENVNIESGYRGAAAVNNIDSESNFSFLIPFHFSFLF